ncbi:hypothetical protein HYU17_01245 [Candidatus Woesearchaeota archaeon]|nr:hypothetical protein [Candidatus Woesearchaeota archaeon]
MSLLERIVNAASLPDKAVKLALDAVAAGVSKASNGRFDNFSLAKLAVYGSSVSIGTAAALMAREGHYANASLIAPFVLLPHLTLGVISDMRNYFLSPKDTLDKNYETILSILRHCRFPFLIAGGLVSAGMIKPSSVNYLNYAQGGAFIASAAFAYFIDGDHTLWSKAKDAPKKVWQVVSSLLPRGAPQPVPEPVPVAQQ